MSPVKKTEPYGIVVFSSCNTYVNVCDKTATRRSRNLFLEQIPQSGFIASFDVDSFIKDLQYYYII